MSHLAVTENEQAARGPCMCARTSSLQSLLARRRGTTGQSSASARRSEDAVFHEKSSSHCTSTVPSPRLLMMVPILSPKEAEDSAT